MTKGFRVKPEAARQFDMLKAEVSGNGKDKGPALIAEALNLLFQKARQTASCLNISIIQYLNINTY